MLSTTSARKCAGSVSVSGSGTSGAELFMALKVLLQRDVSTAKQITVLA
jgi:hypothetical protein